MSWKQSILDGIYFFYDRITSFCHGKAPFFDELASFLDKFAQKMFYGEVIISLISIIHLPKNLLEDTFPNLYSKDRKVLLQKL